MSEHLTPAEAAAYLKRSPETLRYWRHCSKGPTFFRMESRVFYDRAELDHWLDRLRKQAQ
ncbi:Helix-turn-helix domain-containing protein [Quadrisphaera granulorum]|uniref:Helix-turn-helix protein n=1 Tax=Quadrisphaera granulorum TaxID=317664 RepID=A0A315ZQW5_9ACTN|nr:helix-turn-helix protein [Quadrisphaera granulorum]SZE98837.1 Helix-turn-helix domain-containing protein [Quadrisphaera granulorum]